MHSDSPGGSEPLDNTYEYGGPLPSRPERSASAMWLYELPTIPVGGRHGFVLSQLSSLNASACRGGDDDTSSERRDGAGARRNGCDGGSSGGGG